VCAFLDDHVGMPQRFDVRRAEGVDPLYELDVLARHRGAF
jgi:hypothetical protein